MNARWIEERREMFLGEELVYYVERREALPAPSQDVEDPDHFVQALSIPTRFEPAPPAFDRMAYVRAVLRAHKPSVGRAFSRLNAMVGAFADISVTMTSGPRRARRALRTWVAQGVVAAYDTAGVAKVEHYTMESARRRGLRDAGARPVLSLVSA